MKFKENAIKPGMVIHCPKEEDANALLKHLENIGYIWDDEFECKRGNQYAGWSYYGSDTCFGTGQDSKIIVWSKLQTWQKAGLTIAEFSDLIEPDDSPINSPTDSPMMAAELLKWIREGFINGCAGLDNRLREVFKTISVEDILTKFTVEEIIEKIERYEAAKKAPKPVKVKEGYYCDIYTEDEQIINYIMHGVDEQTAKNDAREKAVQNTRETGSRTFADVKFVCEEDES